MEDDDEIRISYETLYESLRNEKQKDEIIPLPKNFSYLITEYIEEKKNIIKSPDINENEREKTRVQLKNIKRIIKELFDRREKKIIILAMNLSRNDDILYDKNSFLDKELDYLKSLKELLTRYRQDFILKVSSGENKKAEKKTISDNVEPDKKKVKFLSYLPKFVSPEGIIYGPFEPGDESELPEQIIKVLLKKNKAELV